MAKGTGITWLLNVFKDALLKPADTIWAITVLRNSVTIPLERRNTRDINWPMQQFRDLLLGRRWKRQQLRFHHYMSTRSPPPPVLPDGPAHKLSANSYVDRDVRRQAQPPKIVHFKHQGKEIEAKVGETLLTAARAANIDIEAACDGSCACSTCHVFLDEESFRKLPPASDEEEDMLDLALFVQPTSRLCCQIIVTEDLDGLELKLPAATRNFYVDKPKNE